MTRTLSASVVARLRPGTMTLRPITNGFICGQVRDGGLVETFAADLAAAMRQAAAWLPLPIEPAE